VVVGGHEILTDGVPREAGEIEAAMATTGNST
jgi:hypothetical protein